MNYEISKVNRFRKALPRILAPMLIFSSLIMTVSLVAGASPDFSVSANPLSLCVNPGIDAQSQVSVTSLNGFSGTVDLSANVSPSGGNTVTLSSIPSSETLSSGQTVSFPLGISTTTSTPLYTYTITVTGFSSTGSILHQTNIELTVATGCSVGGVIVPTSHSASSGATFVTAIAVAGLLALVATGFLLRVKRNKSTPNL